MTNNNKNNQANNKNGRHTTGIIIPIFRYIFSLLGLLFLGYVVSLLIEWVMILFNGWDEPYSYHAQVVASKYLTLIESDTNNFEKNYIISPVQSFLFIENGFDYFGLGFERIFTFNQTFNSNSSWTANMMKSLFYSFLYVSLSFLIKVSYLISSIPLLFILSIQFLCDGYRVRMSNIYKGKLPSDFMLGLSRGTISFGLFSLSLIFISLPIYINPVIAVIPMFIITAIGLRALVIYFAKNF